MADIASTQQSGTETAGGHAHVTGTERHPAWLRISLFAAVVLAGLVTMNAIASLRKDPPVREQEEVILRGSGIVAHTTDYSTTLRGYGTLRSKRVTDILPQVAGRVLEINPALKPGGIIAKDDLLVRIDDADYIIAATRAEAEVLQAEAEVERLRRENESDQTRLGLTENMLELTKRDYERIRSLVDDGGAESAASLDRKAMEVTAEEDRLASMQMAIDLFPARLKATEARLKTARATLEDAQLDLQRTRLLAPYQLRIVSESVEIGQYITPLSRVLRVADDSVLEINVSLDGSEASRWLPVGPAAGESGWFSPDESAPVTIRWTGDAQSIQCPGRMVRIADYNPETRTVIVVIEALDCAPGAGGTQGLTLMAGMFCEVEIGGRTAPSVIPIPRDAVDSQGNVLTVADGHLRTMPVEVLRYDGETALVSSGLSEGDIVLLTRPGSVIDGMRVEVTLPASNDGGTEG